MPGLTAGLFQCGEGLPIMLVWIVAGVLIVQRMESHRTAAFLALGGIAVGVLELLMGVASSAYIPVLVQQGASEQTISVFIGAFGVTRTVVAAISWGLVLAGLVIALGLRHHPEGI